jgi:hypothetical protein
MEAIKSRLFSPSDDWTHNGDVVVDARGDKQLHRLVSCDRDVLAHTAAKSGQIDSFCSLVGKSIHGCSPAKLMIRARLCVQQDAALLLLAVNFQF